VQENRAGQKYTRERFTPSLIGKQWQGRICLDLGVGDKKEKGWIGVDSRKEGRVQPDVVADIAQRLPFDDDYADEIRAIHIIEHFWPWDVDGIVKEWVRVLKPGGKMAIECPDIDKVLALANVPQIPPSFTFWALYGDPRHKSPEMMHRWCYNNIQIARLLNNAGLERIAPEPVRFHHPVRDLRVVGYKPQAANRIVLG
jgi:SAM-dependent methyltransferase